MRTFALTGGRVSVFCAGGDVHVTGLTPAAGFTGSETRFSPDSVRITFASPQQRVSQVWVSWRNKCYAEITESV